MAHYYERLPIGTIEPRHFVEMSTRPGELRPTRISDVRKWWKDGRTVCPSVTTVLNVLDKPALMSWKIDQHLEVAMHVDQRQEVEPWIAEVKRLTELQMDIAPSAGTDIHKVLERFYSGEQPLPEHSKLCLNVDMEIVEKTGNFGWKPERNFMSSGFGGQADLSKDGWVIDFKTKQTAEKFKPGKMAYDDHTMQLAAYRQGLGMPAARCANVFICIENGEVDFHEHTPEELDKGWKLFQHALAIWELQNGAAIAA